MLPKNTERITECQVGNISHRSVLVRIIKATIILLLQRNALENCYFFSHYLINSVIWIGFTKLTYNIESVMTLTVDIIGLVFAT